MTRQERRKMERELKKRNGTQFIQDTNDESEYKGGLGFIIYDLNTLKTYDSIPRGVNPYGVEYTKLNSKSIYQTTFIVDVENDGLSSPCITHIIHNIDLDEVVMKDLFFSVLGDYINSPLNKCVRTLNTNTRFSIIMGIEFDLDSSLLDTLVEYLCELSESSLEDLKSLYPNFGLTG